MADVKFEVTRFALTTATAGNTQDVTISGFGTPKAAIFICSSGETDDTERDEALLSIGFTDGTNQNASAITADDSVTTMSSSRQHSNARVITAPYFSGPSDNFGFSFDSWVTDGVRIAVDNQAPNAFLCTCILISGSDVSNVHVGLKDDLGTSASTVDINTVGFEPDLVLIHGNGNFGSSYPDGTDHGILSFGAGINDGSDTQRSTIISSRSAVGTSNQDTLVSNTRICGQMFNDSVSWVGTIGSYDSSGFSITPNTSPGNDIIFYLCLKFTGSPDLALFDMEWPTSGNYAETSPGFTPSFGLICSSQAATSRNTGTSGDTSLSLALFDGNSIYTNTYADEDGVTTQNSSCLSSDQLRILDGAGGSDAVLASSYAFDADGWDFTLTTNPGSAILGWGLAIGAGAGGTVSGSLGTASETDSALSITPSTTVSASLGTASETDSALTVTPVTNVSATLGTASETDSALTVTPVTHVTAVLGTAAETDAATSITPVTHVTAVLGTATETDTALTVVPTTNVTGSLGTAAETDTAISITPVTDVSATLGTASETDTALAITGTVATTVAVGTATETDTALTVIPVTDVSALLGTASETQLAISITPVTNVTGSLGTAAEANSALSITPTVVVSATLGTASEADTAQPITAVTAVVGALGTATETQLAFSITPAVDLYVSIGTATETDSALSITPSAVTVSVTCTLVNRTGATLPGLTALSWAWFDNTDPNNFTAPTDQGQIETTDGAGVIAIDLPNSVLSPGQQGTLILRADDGSALGAYNLAVA